MFPTNKAEVDAFLERMSYVISRELAKVGLTSNVGFFCYRMILLHAEEMYAPMEKDGYDYLRWIEYMPLHFNVMTAVPGMDILLVNSSLG